MTGESNAVELEGVLQARRVARAAALMEQARGKRGWQSVLLGAILMVAITWFAVWAKLGVQACVGFMLLCGLAGWSESHLSRRIDAVVRLLDQRAD